MRHREFARHIRAAEFVRHDCLAARGGLLRKGIELLSLAHRFEKQHEAVDTRIVQHRRTNVAHRKIRFIADRNQARKADATRLAARCECADHAAAVGCDEDAAGGKVGFGEGGVRGEEKLLPQIDDAQTRRSDDADPGAGNDVP